MKLSSKSFWFTRKREKRNEARTIIYGLRRQEMYRCRYWILWKFFDRGRIRSRPAINVFIRFIRTIRRHNTYTHTDTHFTSKKKKNALCTYSIHIIHINCTRKWQFQLYRSMNFNRGKRKLKSITVQRRDVNKNYDIFHLSISIIIN